MPRFHRRCLNNAALLAALACFALLPTVAGAQYIDTTTGCLLCHRTALPQNDFCKLVPATIWEQSDKHNRAFSLLHDTDAKRELVRHILGFDLREAFVDDRYSRLKDDPEAESVRKVAAVKACLRCHATWPKEADEKYPHTPPTPLELGVSCEACHGPGQLWETPHRLPAWRLVTPAAKASLGCTDVRTTTEKAKLCVSCHVGDLAHDKFVKHEWYAAGHPPLPSFELASFEARMPVHWQSLREKGAFILRDARLADDAGQLANLIAAIQRAGVPLDAIKASYREANALLVDNSGHDPCSDLPRTRDAIVAGAVVLESYVRLLSDYTTSAAEGKAAWPELALYDCAACHHELRSGLGLKDRPIRRHAPGRPPLATWPIALAQLSAAQASGYDEKAVLARWSPIRGRLSDLEQAATSRPFGDLAAIDAATKPLAASLMQLTADAAASRFDATAASNALRHLSNPSTYETQDYATARQAAWAIRAIAGDLELANADQLFASCDDDWLALTLPSGPDRSVVDNLRRWLSAAARYDAERYRAELQNVKTSP
jgi:hypothetical protein